MRKAFLCPALIIARLVIGSIVMTLLSAVRAHAQEATLLGKLTDASGAVHAHLQSIEEPKSFRTFAIGALADRRNFQIEDDT